MKVAAPFVHETFVHETLSIHHSDRGVQYASNEYTGLLEEREIQISMSRRGNPYDNARAERFMRTLKEEEVYGTSYLNLEDARARIVYQLRGAVHYTPCPCSRRQGDMIPIPVSLGSVSPIHAGCCDMGFPEEEQWHSMTTKRH
jgi:Integrase core domain